MIIVQSRSCNAALILILGFLVFGSARQGLAAEPQPNLSQWTLELRRVLKQEATSRETAAHPAAVVALCDLCAAMRSDDRYVSSSVLQGLAARSRRRLLDVRQDIQLALKRDGIEKPIDFDQQILELQRTAAQRTDSEQPDSQESDSEQPGSGFAPGPDNGFLLIELITRTVSPDFWTSQGGPGVVHYYGLQRVLVVRATTRVHEDIQSLLHALGGFPQ